MRRMVKEDSAIDLEAKGEASHCEVRTEINGGKVRVVCVQRGRMRCVPQVSSNDRDLRYHCCDRIVYMRAD